MSPSTSNVIVSIAMAVVAVAVVFQAAMVFGMYKAAKAASEQLKAFMPKAEGFLATAETTLKESRSQIQELTTKANTVIDTTQAQLNRIDGLVQDASAKAKVQMERVEMMLDDTLSRVHATVVQVNNGVLKPLRELNAVSSGIRAAIGHLFRGGRPSVAQVTADEEMFI